MQFMRNYKIITASIVTTVILLIFVFAPKQSISDYDDFKIVSSSVSQSGNSLFLAVKTATDVTQTTLHVSSDVVGLGYLWAMPDPDGQFDKVGFLANIHIKNGLISGSWHNEKVRLLEDDNNSFCFYSKMMDGDISVSENQIRSIFSADTIESDKIESAMLIEITEDSLCESKMRAIIIDEGKN